MTIAQPEQPVNFYKMMTTRMSKGNVPLPNQTGVLWQGGQFTVGLTRLPTGLILIFYMNGNRITSSETLATWGRDYDRISGGGKWTAGSESKLYYQNFVEKAQALVAAVQS